MVTFFRFIVSLCNQYVSFWEQAGIIPFVVGGFFVGIFLSLMNFGEIHSAQRRVDARIRRSEAYRRSGKRGG